jgi:two-component system, OmpR family, response regulator RstA
MGQTTVALIAGNTKIYSDLKHLLGKGDILLRQVEQWEGMLSLFKTDSPHLIILDCPGSGVDGLAMCQEIRADYSGLLVLVSENVDERFHVLALDLGADAFLPRKAGSLLVAANIRALLRRFAPARPPSVLTFGRLTVNANRRDAFIAGRAAQLSTIEFQLIWSLAQKPGCVVTRDEIYRELYNADYKGYDRKIDLYISRIRQKIGDDSTSPRHLKTVRGVGYQFVGD